MDDVLGFVPAILGCCLNQFYADRNVSEFTRIECKRISDVIRSTSKCSNTRPKPTKHSHFPLSIFYCYCDNIYLKCYFIFILIILLLLLNDMNKILQGFSNWVYRKSKYAVIYKEMWQDAWMLLRFLSWFVVLTSFLPKVTNKKVNCKWKIMFLQCFLLMEVTVDLCYVIRHFLMLLASLSRTRKQV